MQPCSSCTCRTSCSLLSPYWTKSHPPQCQTSASQNVPTCHLNMTHDSRVIMRVCKLCRGTCFFTKELVHSIAFQWVCFPTSTCSMKSLAESAVRWEEGTMSWTPASANTRHGHPDKTLMFCYVMLVSSIFNGGNGLQQRSAPKIVHVEFLGQNKYYCIRYQAPTSITSYHISKLNQRFRNFEALSPLLLLFTPISDVVATIPWKFSSGIVTVQWIVVMFASQFHEFCCR